MGVAVVDIDAGTKSCPEKDTVKQQDATGKPAAAEAVIPLGHKIALRDFAVGEDVTKYDVVIGRVVKPIKAGQLVHVHNLKTKRWA